MVTKEMSAARQYVLSLDGAAKDGKNVDEMLEVEEMLWGDFIAALYAAMEETFDQPPFVTPWRGVLPHVCDSCGRYLIGIGWGEWTMQHEPRIHVKRWVCPSCLIDMARAAIDE